MHNSGLLILGACSYALAAPVWSDMVPRATSTIEPRDGNSVSIPGIVIAVVFGVIIVAGLVLYFFSANNFIARRGWFQRLREKRKAKQPSANKELLNPFDDDQEALTKRVSFQSERESIMFNRSRSSSLQFAMVEESDESRRSTSQQIYILQHNRYVPVQRVDTVQAQQEATAIESSASQRAATMSTISLGDEHGSSSHSTIPVIITPPVETDQQSRPFDDNMYGSSVDRHEVTREQSTPLTS